MNLPPVPMGQFKALASMGIRLHHVCWCYVVTINGKPLPRLYKSLTEAVYAAIYLVSIN